MRIFNNITYFLLFIFILKNKIYLYKDLNRTKNNFF